MSTVDINNTTPGAVNKKSVQKIVDKFCKFFKLDRIELSIAFVSNLEIKRINKTYRGINKATDVLSFGMLQCASSKKENSRMPELAEIIISYSKAQKQALENGITLEKEIERLLLHGMLHLLGYDHEKKKDAKEMEIMEEKIIRTV